MEGAEGEGLELLAPPRAPGAGSGSRVAPAGQAAGHREESSAPEGSGPLEVILLVGSYFICMIFFPIAFCRAIKILQEYERGIVFRFGRARTQTAIGPGLVFINPLVDELKYVDIRSFSYDIKPQKLLTKDAMTVTVDAVVFAKVRTPTLGLIQIGDRNVKLSVARRTATAVRKMVGLKLLSEILNERDGISKSLVRQLNPRNGSILVEKVMVKNIMLPKEMQRAMATEAETTRKAKAKVIASKGEVEASRSLKVAADMLATSPAAVKLRYLHTIGHVSKKNSHTVIMPLPMDALEKIFCR